MKQNNHIIPAITLIGIFFLIITVIIVGGLLIMQKNEREWKLQDDRTKANATLLEKKKEEDDNAQRKLDLASCLAYANSSAVSFWNSECKVAGVDKRSDDCKLPTYNANRVDEFRKNEEEKCMKLYN